MPFKVSFARIRRASLFVDLFTTILLNSGNFLRENLSLQAKKTENRLLLQNFALRLRGAMESQGVTQTSLARRLGVSHPSVVGHWARGKNYPSQDLLPRLASELGVTVDWLLNGRQSDHRNSVLDRSPGEVHEPIERYETVSKPRSVNFAPGYEPPPEFNVENLQGRIESHIGKWVSASRENPEIGAYLMAQLKMHLPLSALDKLKEE